MLEDLVHVELVGPDRLHMEAVDDAALQPVVGLGPGQRRRIASPCLDEFDGERRARGAELEPLHRIRRRERPHVVPQQPESARTERRQHLDRHVLLEARRLLLPQIRPVEPVRHVPVGDRVGQADELELGGEHAELRGRVAGHVDEPGLHRLELGDVGAEGGHRVNLELHLDVVLLLQNLGNSGHGDVVRVAFLGVVARNDRLFEALRPGRPHDGRESHQGSQTRGLLQKTSSIRLSWLLFHGCSSLVAARRPASFDGGVNVLDQTRSGIPQLGTGTEGYSVISNQWCKPRRVRPGSTAAVRPGLHRRREGECRGQGTCRNSGPPPPLARLPMVDVRPD